MKYKYIVSLGVLLASYAVTAQEVSSNVELVWDRPTMMTDGSVLTTDDIHSTQCDYRQAGVNGWTYGATSPNGTAETLQFDFVGIPGTYEIACRVRHVNSKWSVYSATDEITIALPDLPEPNPPGNVTVAVVVTIRVN
jgi:hypothetical protein